MFRSKRSRTNELLNELAAKLPETRWLLLLDKQGREMASFPEQIGHADRLAAMTAAAQSLGERITSELKGGELRYALLAGTLNVHLVVMLGTGHVLALGLRPTASVDALLQALKESVAPLRDELNVTLPQSWLD